MFYREAIEPVIPSPQECVGHKSKYTGTGPFSNGSNMWYTSPCINGSNRQGILSTKSGADRVWENIPKKICCHNIPKTIDRVDDHVRVNGSVSYDSPMTSNPKHRVSFANIVRGMMRK